MVFANSKIDPIGVKLPFYREYGDPTPTVEKLVEGQNYGEHELFSLRTRLESDREYADLCQQLNTNISFVKTQDEKGMTVNLVISYIKEGKICNIVPDWLSEKVEKYLSEAPDYFVLLSDRYATGIDETLPTWWLRDILSKINLTEMILDVFYPDDLTIESRNSHDIRGYDTFYKDGLLYIRLIDPRSSRDFSSVKNYSNIPLNSGEQTFRRTLDVTGDYADYSDRYYGLQLKLLQTLDKWYKAGTLVLNPISESETIKNWNLVSLKDQKGIYQASWNDARFTFYEGITQMLYRQLSSYSNMWNYGTLYYYLGTNPAAVHDIVKVVSDYGRMEKIVVQGDLLLLKIDNYNDAISYADMMSELRMSSRGTVIKNVTKSSGSIEYYDAIDKRNTYISRVPDEMKFLVYSPRVKSPKEIISLPDFSQFMTPTLKTGLSPQNLESPLYSFGSPLPLLGGI